MAQNRRDFIKTSAAITVFAVSKASAQVPRSIGMVHSTEFNMEFQDCFFLGLANMGWARNPTPAQNPINIPIPPRGANPGNAQGHYGGSYGQSALEKLVRDHRQQGVPMHVVVVGGGLASHLAAWSELTNVDIPFVYLAGRMPQTTPSADGKYCGVILHYSAQHSQAVAQFNQLGISTASVWLVQNANSGMSAPEWQDWKSTINGNRFMFFDKNANNDETKFQGEVTKLKALNPMGIVVSSDPFFRLKATQFVTAMRAGLGNNVTICYPFPDFTRSGNDFLLPGRATLSSTNPVVIPNTAYYMLGQRVGDVLNNSTTTQPVPTTPISSVQWNGATWQ
jgi:hypothetical protein